jgi:hypothetical protein
VADYVVQDVPWLQLVPGQVIEGQRKDLLLVTRIAEPYEFEREFTIEVVGAGGITVKRRFSAEKLAKYPTTRVLVPVVVDEQAALDTAAELGATVVTDA